MAVHQLVALLLSDNGASVKGERIGIKSEFVGFHIHLSDKWCDIEILIVKMWRESLLATNTRTIPPHQGDPFLSDEIGNIIA